MKARNSHLLLPTAIAVGSFFCLLAIMLFTNPVEDVSYTLVFFMVLAVMLVNLGYILVKVFGQAEVSAMARRRILILSILVVIFLMFRSAGSFSWVDLLVMLLLGSVLLFYSSRR